MDLVSVRFQPTAPRPHFLNSDCQSFPLPDEHY
jgi:hypothetical protein